MTKIRALNETWDVPQGFGASYLRLLRDYAARIETDSPGVLISEVTGLLGLVGYHVTPEQITGWGLRRRVEAVIYAATEHARASDNPVPRHPRPSWLPELPWQGPELGDGPSGTSVEEV